MHATGLQIQGRRILRGRKTYIGAVKHTCRKTYISVHVHTYIHKIHTSNVYAYILQDFEFRVEEFFGAFKRNMPWEYSTHYDRAYDVMDKIHHGPKSDDNPTGSLIEIKADSQRLNEMQELFELFVVEYRQVLA